MKTKVQYGILLAADDHEASLVLGTNKSDDIVTGGGPQYIISGNGSDVISAGGGPDIVEAGNGKDTVEGGGGPDIAEAANGKDILFGGGGPDVLSGGNGKDVLVGGPAADILTGGAGADTFVYTFHGDAPAHGEEEAHEAGEADSEGEGEGHSGPSVETITDFQFGLDQIDLSQLELVSGFSDHPAAFSVWVEQDGDNAIVRIDTNGDISGEHAAEMAICLIGVDAQTLSAGDFIL